MSVCQYTSLSPLPHLLYLCHFLAPPISFFLSLFVSVSVSLSLCLCPSVSVSGWLAVCLCLTLCLARSCCLSQSVSCSCTHSHTVCVCVCVCECEWVSEWMSSLSVRLSVSLCVCLSVSLSLHSWIKMSGLLLIVMSSDFVSVFCFAWRELVISVFCQCLQQIWLLDLWQANLFFKH